MISSPPLFKLVSEFVVHDPSVFSDHAPVSLTLDICFSPSTCMKEKSQISKTMWDDNKQLLYSENLTKTESIDILSEMNIIIEDYTCISDDISVAVNAAVNCFTHAVRLASDPLFLNRKYV